MKAVKGKVFVWNPHVGWEALRRTPSYIKAVRNYEGQLKGRKDKDGLRVFEYLKKLKRPMGVSGGFHLKKNKWFPNGIASLTQEEWTNYFSMSSSGVDIITSVCEHLEVDPQKITETRYFKNFQRRYGDIISYPLSPKNFRPTAPLISGLWMLKPASIVSPISSDGNTCEFTVKLNMNFSDSAIIKRSENIVRLALEHSRQDMEPSKLLMQPIKWDELRDKIVAFETYNEGELGYQKIGDKYNKSKSPQSRKKWAENSIRYVKNKLFHMLSR